MKRTLFLLLTVAMLTAGCGGSDDPSAVTEDVVETLDEIDTESAVATASEAAGEVVGAIDDAGCEAAAEALAGVPTSVADLATGQGDMAEVQSQIEAFDEVAQSAPDDVAADFDFIANAFNEVGTTLSELDLESGTAPGAEAQAALSEVASTMSAEEFTSATANVSNYFAEGCPS